jgi:hypothetical protein
LTLSVSDVAGNYQSTLLASMAILSADFPDGTTYTYQISGGTPGSETATLSTPASDKYSATVPYFTNNGFTSLQDVNASSAINLTWEAYATPAGVNTPLTFIGITQVSDGASVFSVSGSNTFTSTTVSANRWPGFRF